MGRFTEEEIQLASKREIIFYPINREMGSQTMNIFFTRNTSKSEKVLLVRIVKFIGKFIHWINQYGHFSFKVKTSWPSSFHFLGRHLGILRVSYVQ